MNKTLLFLLLLLSYTSFSQFSKTHYIPPLTAQDGMAEDHYLYISTPTATDITFKIIEIGGAVITKTVSNTNPYTHSIGTGGQTQLFTPKNRIGILANKGYIIEADDLIYVSVRTNADLATNGQSYNHAGGLVSKGNSALGTEFRLGAMLNSVWDPDFMNFASILATENGTKITISNLPIGTKLTDGTVVNGPINIILNRNESYVLALENYNDGSTPTNSSKMIGALVSSSKPVVVNSGSFGGSNSSVLGHNGLAAGKDIGFDQIVSFEKTGKEYIFVKGNGTTPALERVLLIAHKPQTAIYLHGNTIPFATLANPGDKLVLDGSNYTNGNMYVTTSENVFAYQSIAGKATAAANQNLFFVPPINCATPNTVDNIPHIELIGSEIFVGKINIVTEKGATVLINDAYVRDSPVDIDGNPGFVRYSAENLSGNTSIKSDKQIYVSYFGINGAATYGGYYSGFDSKPEIVSNKVTLSDPACIPNVKLSVNTLTSFDKFQWIKNDNEILGETTASFVPTTPGYYKVRGWIDACGTNMFSDEIPVSECPTNVDNDLANDNIDLDNDNDGITNCTESYGNQNINISNSAAGNLVVGTYSNLFTGVVSTTGTFVGNVDGSFITEVPAGKNSNVSYTMTFAKPISLGMEYVTTANSNDLLNIDADYILKCDVDKTITVLNYDNQLLIDTNYDGNFESGVTEFSSFEIRFRLNSTQSLAAGTGTFKFLTYLTNSIRFTHKNLSETASNKSTLKFFASCVPKDTDGDGIPDQLDDDSDNDGVLDLFEGNPDDVLALSNIDINKNGLDDLFEPIVAPIDTDLDGIYDYLDLDSDNDGIYDEVETGIADTDTDTDGIKDYRDLDSDNDTCFDVAEAGFTDLDTDGMLGDNPITIDVKGIVSSGTDGYTVPNSNYIAIAPIPVITKEEFTTDCGKQEATITITADAGNDYKWETYNGSDWTSITDDLIYSGATTNILTIKNFANGSEYRASLSKKESACRTILSSVITLITLDIPTVNDVTMEACDTDLDGITNFDLTSKNAAISSNHTAETFRFYTSLDGANNVIASDEITNPTTYTNTTAFSQNVWVRIDSSSGCPGIAQITLSVGVIIPSSFSLTTTPEPVCDDAIQDGITTFNLTATKDYFDTLFPPTGYVVSFYPTEIDATNQTAAITNLASYRNTIPTTQAIWTRVNNTDTAFSNCYTLATYFSLNVEPLPITNPVTITPECDDDQDGIFTFDTSTLEATLLGGQTNKIVSYLDAANNPLKDANGVLITSPFPATFTTKSQTIKASIKNNTTQTCTLANPESIVFTVNIAPAVNDVTIEQCDTDLDGMAIFNLTSKNSTISQNAAVESFTYYTSVIDATNNTNSITNPTTYTNTTPFLMDVWARVTNTNNCVSIAKITLKIATSSIAYPVTITPECDENKDGIFTFDTSTLETTLLGGQTNKIVSYLDAARRPLKDINGILITSPFPQTFTTRSQTIQAIVNNTNNQTCTIAASTSIAFTVVPKPVVIDVIFPQCDADTDGITSFDLTSQEASISINATNETFAYYTSETAAINNTTSDKISNPNIFQNTTAYQMDVWARVTNANNCSNTSKITLNAVVAFPITPLVSCDDEIDPITQDGKFGFDTSTLEDTVLGQQSGMIVRYYDQNNRQLPSPLPNPFVTNTQTIRATVTSPANPNCSASSTISFTVNPLPRIDTNTDGNENQTICALTTALTLDAGIIDTSNPNDYTYIWSKDGAIIPNETSYTLNNITTAGNYTVAVTNTLGCSRQRTITVIISDTPKIKSVDVVDLTDINTITINLVKSGNYQYSLDAPNGPYQDSNFFYDVAYGIHDVYVYDPAGCGFDTKTVVVIQVPKFFTPNNDGYNDYWNIKGADNNSYEKTIIYLFDRYGKLIITLTPRGNGWDGTLDGAPLPSDDYWYSIKLPDGRTAKGHFSLKR